MFSNKSSKALPVLLTMASLLVMPVAAPVEVGEKFPIHIDSAMDYRGSDDGTAVLAWTHEIYQPAGGLPAGLCLKNGDSPHF